MKFLFDVPTLLANQVCLCWRLKRIHLQSIFRRGQQRVQRGKSHMILTPEQTNALIMNRATILELFSGDPDFMTSLAKGLIILEVLKSSPASPTIANLSGITGLSRAAVRRCLYTLSKLTYVRSTKDGNRELWSRTRIVTSGAGPQKTLTCSVGPHSQRSGGDEPGRACDQR
jgi:hypothetical protein